MSERKKIQRKTKREEEKEKEFIKETFSLPSFFSLKTVVSSLILLILLSNVTNPTRQSFPFLSSFLPPDPKTQQRKEKKKRGPDLGREREGDRIETRHIRTFVSKKKYPKQRERGKK